MKVTASLSGEAPPEPIEHFPEAVVFFGEFRGELRKIAALRFGAHEFVNFPEHGAGTRQVLNGGLVLTVSNGLNSHR